MNSYTAKKGSDFSDNKITIWINTKGHIYGSFPFNYCLLWAV